MAEETLNYILCSACLLQHVLVQWNIEWTNKDVDAPPQKQMLEFASFAYKLSESSSPPKDLKTASIFYIDIRLY